MAFFVEQENMTKQSEETAIAIIATTVKNIEKDVDEIKTKLEKNYVTREEFEPVKKIVYGLVALILIAVVGAMIALVLQK